MVQNPTENTPSSRGASSADRRSHYADFGFEKVLVGEKQARVGEVFSSVARNYDLMNDLMSAGLHRLWKDAMVAWLAPDTAKRVGVHLDIAGGTGDIAFRVARAARSPMRSLVLDINPEMVRAGAKRNEAKRAGQSLHFMVGNAQCLPVPDASIDYCTIAFGIRNVTDIAQALREARRVLKIGGRFMCLEFSHVEVPVLDGLYDAFSMAVIPRLGGAVAGDRAAYRYLVESIRRFPSQDVFADMLNDAGFKRVAWRNLAGGIAAIHSGWRL
ncbi:MAG: bifunctional demethylmenaquinone methyltransferase/2-methoxy-6-polyprenyl-1,4-benzoquinol methylase UbiE [Alphaproteobacteria bacterium]